MAGKITFTTAEIHVIIESLAKHEASTKRLKAASTNQAITELYEQQLVEIQKLKTKIITGQGDLLK